MVLFFVPMNLLFITQEDYLAGSSYSVSYLTRGLADRGHQVYLLAQEDSFLHGLVKDHPRVNFIPFTIRSRFDIDAMKYLRDIVLQYDIQVINAQSTKDRYITVLARWFFRLEVLIFHTRRQLPMSVGGFFQNLVYVQGTDRIIAVSQGIKDALLKKGIPSNHVEVLYNGLPSEKFISPAIDKTALKSQLGIRESLPVIGCIARRKHQDQLLRSLDLLKRPVSVVLVGLSEDESYRSIIQSHQWPHQVIFVEGVTGAEALKYLQIFDLFVLCSTSEGLSQSLLEAMYARVPVIATRAAGNIDLIQSGQNGLLFENNDLPGLAIQMDRLLTDQKLREHVMKGGFITASDTFSIERTIRSYESFFRSLLSSHESKRHVAKNSPAFPASSLD